MAPLRRPWTRTTQSRTKQLFVQDNSIPPLPLPLPPSLTPACSALEAATLRTVPIISNDDDRSKLVLLFDEKNLEFALAPNVCVDLTVLENTVFLVQNVVGNV